MTPPLTADDLHLNTPVLLIDSTVEAATMYTTPLLVTVGVENTPAPTLYDHILAPVAPFTAKILLPNDELDDPVPMYTTPFPSTLGGAGIEAGEVEKFQLTDPVDADRARRDEPDATYNRPLYSAGEPTTEPPVELLHS